MNALMERWVQTCRRELLDRTLIWNQRPRSTPSMNMLLDLSGRRFGKCTVEVCERALATPGVSDSQRRDLLSRLGDCRLVYFPAEGGLDDLATSVRYAEQALDGLDMDDPEWSDFAGSLAGALLHRHVVDALGGREPDPRDLAQGINTAERMLAVGTGVRTW
ncbi:hypothetical protein [Actinomadura sp. 9N215]|uniref:hypothetical protein n=1 Tax=Actinomadura sp. 9N215 TaxID=3375150 RepID=UPI0037961B4C